MLEIRLIGSREEVNTAVLAMAKGLAAAGYRVIEISVEYPNRQGGVRRYVKAVQEGS